MSWGLRGVNPEHNGAKNGGGYWGLRHDAKEVSKRARRNEDKLEIEDVDDEPIWTKARQRKPRPAKIGRRTERTLIRRDVEAAAMNRHQFDSVIGDEGKERPVRTEQSRWEQFKCWLYRNHSHARTYKVIGHEERWGIITPECVHCGYDELPAPWGGGPRGYA